MLRDRRGEQEVAMGKMCRTGVGNTMNYIEEIRNFVPGCEQEEKGPGADAGGLEKLMGMRSWSAPCELFHLTASSMIFNRERTKVLMAYHNIFFQSWAGPAADMPTEEPDEAGDCAERGKRKRRASRPYVRCRRGGCGGHPGGAAAYQAGQICQRSSAFQSDISVQKRTRQSPAGVRRGGTVRWAGCP